MQKTFEELISSQRLKSYHGKSNNDTSSLILRYDYDIELSKCFYPPLHLLEVALRNTLSTALNNYLNDTQWLINSRSCNFFKDKEKVRIREAINKLTKKRKTVDAGRAIAELNFGFWVNLYDRPYMEFHKKTIKSQFPNASNKQRDIFTVKSRLNEIRLLRNRIFHYEPIWHWSNLDDYLKRIKEVLYWMNSDIKLNSINEAEVCFYKLLERQSTLLK
jgi:hypothetical protein